jgi:hypothetical protein
MIMDAATTTEIDVGKEIAAFKKAMMPKHDVLKRAFADVKDAVSRAALPTGACPTTTDGPASIR